MKTYYKEVCILYTNAIERDMPTDIHERLSKYNNRSGYYGSAEHTLYVAKVNMWDDRDMDSVLAWLRSLECTNKDYWEIMALGENDTIALHETGRPDGITRLSLYVAIRSSLFPTLHLDDFF